MKVILRKFYILGILLILLVIFGLIFQYSYLNNTIMEIKEINMEKSRENLGQEINSELKARLQVILSASAHISTNIWTEENLEEYLERVMEINPTFGILYYGDIHNHMINGVDWVPPEDYDLRTRVWYKKAVEEQNIIYSEAYLDALSGRVIVTISNPIYDDNNKLMGVASGDIFMEEIIKLIEDSKHDNMGYSFLIDGQGHIIAHPNYEYNEYSELKTIDEISDTILQDIKSKGSGRKQIILDEVEGYLFYQPVEETDWIIGSFVSLAEYNENDYPLENMFITTLLISIVIFGGFLFIQNKDFMKPLYLLEEDIGNIDTENNLRYRLSSDKEDSFLDARRAINLALDKTEESFVKQKEYQEELLASHEELEASYGQLSAMEQELREQYTELEKRERKLYHLSHYDQLTGLNNRRFFELELERLDNDDNLPLTLIMADINGLKLINDSFGHQAGDELLKTMGNAMKDACKEDQVVSRIGGDEFVIIIPRSGDKEAENTIKGIRNLAEAKNMHSIELSVSFGIGTKNHKNEDILEILKRAEDDMYSNKLAEEPSMRSRTIDTIVQALYEKNAREEAHSSRVSLLCKQMGIEMGMTEEKIRELEKVGLLHDIGKVAISNEILEKTGGLDEEEWEEIKRHPEVGYRILSTINEMSQIAEYILAHHERCDGTGYPKGLKDEDIPIVSKIIAIADSYDAMVSDRPYRKGLPEEIAISEIIKNAGTQFDAILAKVFIEKVLGKEWTEEV